MNAITFYYLWVFIIIIIFHEELFWDIIEASKYEKNLKVVSSEGKELVFLLSSTDIYREKYSLPKQ